MYNSSKFNLNRGLVPHTTTTLNELDDAFCRSYWQCKVARTWRSPHVNYPSKEVTTNISHYP